LSHCGGVSAALATQERRQLLMGETPLATAERVSRHKANGDSDAPRVTQRVKIKRQKNFSFAFLF